jgi:hypothetical protein
MKKISKGGVSRALQGRSFRRCVKQNLTSLMKRQNCNCSAEHEQIKEILEELQRSIEIIARQVARWAVFQGGKL